KIGGWGWPPIFTTQAEELRVLFATQSTKAGKSRAEQGKAHGFRNRGGASGCRRIFRFYRHFLLHDDLIEVTDADLFDIVDTVNNRVFAAFALIVDHVRGRKRDPREIVARDGEEVAAVAKDLRNGDVAEVTREDDVTGNFQQRVEVQNELRECVTGNG